MKKIAIVMGSDSDLPIIEKAITTLEQFGAPYSVRVLSAHRVPDDVRQFAINCRPSGYGAIISAAGKAAHLAGVIASHTILPVIGIPIKASSLNGLDALLSTVQMPSGVPVATVAIDGAQNAALLALQILANEDEQLAQKLIRYKAELALAVKTKDADIQSKFNKKGE